MPSRPSRSISVSDTSKIVVSNDSTQDCSKSHHDAHSQGHEHRTPSRHDIWIGVTGVTGAGKSSFISLFAEQDIEIGHGLHSATKKVNIFRSKALFNGRVVWFVDTPGFDDTRRSDIEILEEIATYFVKLYQKGIRFSGLLYLQRITDPRMSGTAIKNLELFQLICGDAAASMVRLVTTRWNELSPDTPEYTSCEQRLEQLTMNPQYFGSLLSKGAKHLKLEDRTFTSGKAIIDTIATDRGGVVLAIQEEMLDRKMTLGQTDAGFYLSKEQAALTRRYELELQEIRESLNEALKERDEEALALLGPEYEECEMKKKKLEQDLQNMTADFKELDTRKENDLKKTLTEPVSEQDEHVEIVHCDPNHYANNGHVPVGKDAASKPLPPLPPMKESRRDRMKHYMSSEWHKMTVKGHWQFTGTTLQEVQVWLWDVFADMDRAKSKHH